MESPVDPSLIKVTEIFLIPSSFLVAALGTADTYPHKAAVSFLALIVSVLWQVCSWEAFTAMGPAAPGTVRSSHPQRTVILAWLPFIFVLGWLASTVIHTSLWGRGVHA